MIKKRRFNNKSTHVFDSTWSSNHLVLFLSRCEFPTHLRCVDHALSPVVFRLLTAGVYGLPYGYFRVFFFLPPSWIVIINIPKLSGRVIIITIVIWISACKSSLHCLLCARYTYNNYGTQQHPDALCYVLWVQFFSVCFSWLVQFRYHYHLQLLFSLDIMDYWVLPGQSFLAPERFLFWATSSAGLTLLTEPWVTGLRLAPAFSSAFLGKLFLGCNSTSSPCLTVGLRRSFFGSLALHGKNKEIYHRYCSEGGRFRHWRHQQPFCLPAVQRVLCLHFSFVPSPLFLLSSAFSFFVRPGCWCTNLVGPEWEGPCLMRWPQGEERGINYGVTNQLEPFLPVLYVLYRVDFISNGAIAIACMVIASVDPCT